MAGGVVLMRGDFRPRMNDVFTRFRYRPIKHYEIADWSSFLDEIQEWISEDVVRKGVLFVSGWTVILDPEMVLGDDDALCEEVGSEFNAEIPHINWKSDDNLDAFLAEHEIDRAVVEKTRPLTVWELSEASE